MLSAAEREDDPELINDRLPFIAGGHQAVFKYGLTGTVLLFLALILMAGGITLIIYNAITMNLNKTDNNNLQTFTIDQMFNSSLSPHYSSIEFISSSSSSSSSSKLSGGPVHDEYLRVINGSFYIIAFNNMTYNRLLININDLYQWSSYVQQYAPPMMSSSSGMSSHSSHPRASQHRQLRINRGQHTQSHVMSSLFQTKSVEDSNSTFPYYSYSISPSQQYMLFLFFHQPLYRHSSYDTAFIYDINSKQLNVLHNGAQLRCVQWSPNDQLSYTYNNDVYVWQSNNTTRITSDGLDNAILNGAMDWVYEEEIYEATAAAWWAPTPNSDVATPSTPTCQSNSFTSSSPALAFLRFDQRAVPSYSFSFFTSPYNQEFSYKYPNPGFSNSLVTLQVYVNQQVKTVTIPIEYEYILNVAWQSPTQLFVRTINRQQNKWSAFISDITCDPPSVTQVFQYNEQYYFEPHSSYTSLYPLPLYLDLLLSNDYIHVALFSAQTGFIRFLTSGNYNVLSIVGANVATETVYYLRQLGDYGRNQALFSVNFSQQNVSNNAPLVTSVEGAGGRTFQSVSFSPSMSYFLLQEQAVVPYSALFYINSTSSTPAISLLTTLSNNSALINTLSTYSLPEQVFFTIPSTVPGKVMNAYALFPNGESSLLNADSCDSHPILMYAYSGPGSQQVTSVFPMNYAAPSAFHSLLVSQFNYIVVVVDTIGTLGQGETFRKAFTYKQLGTNERNDIIAANQFIRQKCWADPNQINYWGWSYGGYLSSLVASNGSHLFNHITSVAPVTDWRLYDAVYTERYMITPQENEWGYGNSSVLTYVQNFDADNWLLVGGTADDNVHFQNSALLVDALINQDKPFSVFYFPNRAHSLTQWKTGSPPKYLYQMLLRTLINGTNAGACNTAQLQRSMLNH